VEILTVCRLLQGLGGAAGVVLSRAVVADRAEGPASARIFSLMMIINGTAPVLAPLIGGAASNLIGWRGVFWILSGLATVMLVGAAAVLTETLPFERRVRGGFGALLRDGRQVLLDQAYPWYAMSFGFGFATIGAVRAGGRGGAVGGAGRGCDGCSHGGDADGVRAAGGVGTAVGEGTHQATVWVAPRRPTATGSTTREKGRRVRARALLPS
jgi:MFS family permease